MAVTAARTGIRFPTGRRTPDWWPKTAGQSPGGGQKSLPPAGTATLAGSLSPSARFPPAGRHAASTCCQPRPSSAYSTFKPPVGTWCWGSASHSAWATGLNSPRAPIAPNERVCYWGGWGGSLVVNDVDAGFTMAYVMNRMGPGTVGDDRAHTILRACYASLEG